MSRETIDEMKTQRAFMEAARQDETPNKVQTKSEQETLRSEIKECPICHARCFADMDVCYGCLHVFSEEENCAVGVKDGSSTVLDLLEKPSESTVSKECSFSSEVSNCADGEVAPEARTQKTPSFLKDQTAFSRVLEIVISVRVPEGNASLSISPGSE